MLLSASSDAADKRVHDFYHKGTIYSKHSTNVLITNHFIYRLINMLIKWQQILKH